MKKCILKTKRKFDIIIKILVKPQNFTQGLFTSDRKNNVYITRTRCTSFCNANEKERNNMGANYIFDAVEAAKMLIRLFYKKKMPCTRIVVEKLLSIIYLIGLKNNAFSFSDYFCANACGMGCPALSRYIPDEIFSSNLESVFEQDKGESDVPEIFKGEDIKDAEFTTALSKVFNKFGEWTPKNLGLDIDKFKNEVLSDSVEFDKKKVIDVDKAKIFLKNTDYKQYNSEVLDFICEYKLVEG